MKADSTVKSLIYCDKQFYTARFQTMTRKSKTPEIRREKTKFKPHSTHSLKRFGMKTVIALFSIFSLASVAFADRRSPGDAYIPVDTLNGTGELGEGDTFVFSPRVANPRDLEIICSLYSTGLAKKPGTTTTVEVTKYVKGMVIEIDQDNKVDFNFQNRMFGEGFRLSRSSVKAFASCQDLENDDGSDGVGNCDPRSPGQTGQHCDNTCRADKDDPSQCGKTPSGDLDIFAD